MKPFPRVKEISGHKYAYEVTPYYDKEKKQIRQRCRYLGTYKDGKITRVRVKLPRSAYDYGEFLPLLKISKELQIEQLLRMILSKEMSNIILTLSFNKIVNPVSMSNMKVWFERTYLSKEWHNLPLSSQSLSDFLARIGESSTPMEFSNNLIKNLGIHGKTLLYDITSLSSSSKFIEMLEWGYNRDNDSLPQINLSLAAHKKLGIPLFYDVYPGSIVDVTTLKNTIQKVKAFSFQKPTLILDRGFFSVPNISELCEEDCDFILPASFASKKVKALISQVHGNRENPEYLKKYNDNVIFVMPVKFEAEGRWIDGFLFYDMKREQEEKTRFYERLHNAVEQLRKRELKSWENPNEVFEDIAGEMKGYLKYNVKNAGYEVTVRKNAVSQRVNRMGTTVVLYRGSYTWKDVLGWQRERHIIEKMFMMIKNDLEGVPLRAQKECVVKGLLFVTFISLLLRSRLLTQMKDCDLCDDYSIPTLLLELSKIKKIELADGKIITTEFTKIQKDIIEKLQLEDLCA